MKHTQTGRAGPWVSAAHHRGGHMELAELRRPGAVARLRHPRTAALATAVILGAGVGLTGVGQASAATVGVAPGSAGRYARSCTAATTGGGVSSFVARRGRLLCPVPGSTATPPTVSGASAPSGVAWLYVPLSPTSWVLTPAIPGTTSPGTTSSTPASADQPATGTATTSGAPSTDAVPQAATGVPQAPPVQDQPIVDQPIVDQPSQSTTGQATTGQATTGQATTGQASQSTTGQQGGDQGGATVGNTVPTAPASDTGPALDASPQVTSGPSRTATDVYQIGGFVPTPWTAGIPVGGVYSYTTDQAGNSSSLYGVGVGKPGASVTVGSQDIYDGRLPTSDSIGLAAKASFGISDRFSGSVSGQLDSSGSISGGGTVSIKVPYVDSLSFQGGWYGSYNPLTGQTTSTWVDAGKLQLAGRDTYIVGYYRSANPASPQASQTQSQQDATASKTSNDADPAVAPATADPVPAVVPATADPVPAPVVVPATADPAPAPAPVVVPADPAPAAVPDMGGADLSGGADMGGGGFGGGE